MVLNKFHSMFLCWFISFTVFASFFVYFFFLFLFILHYINMYLSIYFCLFHSIAVYIQLYVDPNPSSHWYFTLLLRRYYYPDLQYIGPLLHLCFSVLYISFNIHIFRVFLVSLLLCCCLWPSPYIFICLIWYIVL